MAAAPPANAVLLAFEAYQSARQEFAKEVSRISIPPEQAAAHAAAGGGTFEVEGAEKVLAALEHCDTLASDVGGLLTDLAPHVQQSAMIAMGRLCGLSQPLRAKLIRPKDMSHIVATIQGASSAASLKAAHFLLFSVVRDSLEGAKAALDAGALTALAEQLETLDPTVKADACWCLAAMASHDAALAAAVADGGGGACVGLLAQCVKEPSLPLKRIALSCLGCIGKHEQSLAEMLKKEGVHEAAAPLLKHRDPLVRRHACRLLALTCAQLDAIGHLPSATADDAVACIREAQHEKDVETGSFAAALLGQLARRSPTFASAMRENDAAPALVSQLALAASSPVPAALALGYFCDAQPDVAPELRRLGAVRQIKTQLDARPPPHVGAALCVPLGAMGAADAREASEIAKCGALHAAARATILGRRRPHASGLGATRTALCRVLARCQEYTALSNIFLEMNMPADPAAAPPTTRSVASGAATAREAKERHVETEVLAALLRALASTFTARGSLRQDFQARGMLVRAQQCAHGEPELVKALGELNATFPPQMVAATDPGYEQRLLAQLE